MPDKDSLENGAHVQKSEDQAMRAHMHMSVPHKVPRRDSLQNSTHMQKNEDGAMGTHMHKSVS